MSAGYDAEVAELFRDLRVASKLTETDLASRIATPVEVVLALEQGAIYALPPWPETCRVVNAYGTLLNLDTRPLLRRIYAQLEAGVVELGPRPVPDVPVMVPPAGGNAGPALAQAPQQSAPQAPVWPNGQGGAQQSAQPQALQPGALQAQVLQPQTLQQPRPQATQAQAPQVPQPAAWPGAARQAPPNAQPMTQPMAQGLAPPAPAWPNGPGAQTSQPQAYAPEPAPLALEDASFPGEAHPQQPPASYASESGAQPLGDATFLGEPALEPEPQAKKKPGLLKWGIAALVAAVVLIGLWIALGGSSSETGLISGFSTSEPVLDPNDPRSRKADRLPDNFPQ